MSYLPLLQCPVCLLTLSDPTTLHCGHSVCAKHLHPSATCICTSHRPQISASSSRVAYLPPPSSTRVPQPRIQSERKLDVTISKLISLIVPADVLTREDDVASSSSISDNDDLSPAPVAVHRTTRPREESASPSHRPHKRRRHRRSGDSLLFNVNVAPPPQNAQERFEKDLRSELNCEICLMLFYQPVTTPCQHTFCGKCLQRSLDHSNQCPLCREDLPGFPYFQDHPQNQTILAILLKAFPDAYDERGRVLEREERDARLDTPIFVCQLAFPGMPTLLHFFEPRYRLMLRRCLESPNPCFGMVMPPRVAPTPGDPGNGNDYGTMLEIRSVQMLPDGRSMVETRGTHRFKILERGSLDGYMVGRIERIDDYGEEVTDEENAAAFETYAQSAASEQDLPLLSRLLSPSPPSSHSLPSQSPPLPSTTQNIRSNEELMAVCRDFLEQLQQGTVPWVVQRLNDTYGPMPSDPSSFSFWVALVLPIDEQEKAKLLRIRSARLRLRLVVHWIEQLNSNWWFSSGCVIL